jgi:NTE family protein
VSTTTGDPRTGVGDQARSVAEAHGLLSPVRHAASDPSAVATGIGLCLSGGGFRAMLFHAGSLLRLNEAGYLGKLTRVSSVSGGSIASAVLATRWKALGLDTNEIGRDFERVVIEPLRQLASKTLDVPCVLKGWLTPGSTINDRLAASYRRALFSGLTLRDLPDHPDFMFNATNLQTGELWRFSKQRAGDWRVGEMSNPDTDLARVVAASSAFPPVLSPAIFEFVEGDLKDGGDSEVACVPYTTRAVLADGGIYDNLGLETVWKNYNEVLISDGGGHMPDLPRPGRLWSTQAVRVLHTIDNQVRDLRKRQAVSSFVEHTRKGAYWGIRSHVRDYALSQPLYEPSDAEVQALAKMPTRLAKIAPVSQDHLINWGYLICDTALRRWIDPDAKPGALPYPHSGLGGGTA